MHNDTLFLVDGACLSIRLAYTNTNKNEIKKNIISDNTKRIREKNCLKWNDVERKDAHLTAYKYTYAYSQLRYINAIVHM